MSDKHPYKEYESSKNWKLIEKAISDLVDNQDLKEMTDRKRIVGYICKLLSEE